MRKAFCSELLHTADLEIVASFASSPLRPSTDIILKPTGAKITTALSKAIAMRWVNQAMLDTLVSHYVDNKLNLHGNI